MTLPPARDVVRNAGRTVLSIHHWKARLLLWSAAVAVGVVAVAFARLADLAQLALRWLLAIWPWWPWLLTPLGFAGVAWLTRRFFRGAEGSGIPQTIFILRPEAGDDALWLVKPHVVVGRMALACVGLFCGGSIGREGPTVHVGAAIAHTFGRWMPHGGTSAQRRALILAGGAAGVAAAFNTPLAGIVFAIEELSRSFEERASGATLTAVVLAGVVAIAIIGDYTYFGQPTVASAAQSVSLGTFVVALSGGLAGGLFSRLTLIGVNGLPGPLGKLHKERPALFAGACGIFVAAVAAASGGLTYGTGYAEARSILEGNVHLSWIYAPARALATLVTGLSGIPAGLLAPSLSVGAGLGQMVADVSGQSTPVPFAILGMCGYLAGATQAPITSFVIVMEMTTQHAMVMPLMITAAVATAVSKLISPPLYRTLALRYAG
ncbi:MAG TPA: chloride channel protein [Steroidobacteraceae bacterium]|nr:chloride channel protein [Steroidobacteraceae bacterium]